LKDFPEKEWGQGRSVHNKQDGSSCQLTNAAIEDPVEDPVNVICASAVF